MVRRLVVAVLLWWPVIGLADAGQPGGVGDGDGATPTAAFVSQAVRGDPTARYLLDVITRKAQGDVAVAGQVTAERGAADTADSAGLSREYLRTYVGLNLAAALGRALQGTR